MSENTYENLFVLSMGVSDYSQIEGHENIISASFDSILVANKYE